MYFPKLNLLETEQAIKKLKDYFETLLAQQLNLLRVSAPLCLEADKGLNDTLKDFETPILFELDTGQKAEIILSLAKWKRMALYKYEIASNSGIYTDMNAIHPKKHVDAMHSIYVDQWDWEKVISPEERTREKLEEIVNKIYFCFKQLEQFINHEYPQLTAKLPDEIFFITTQELENLFPTLSPQQREYQIASFHGAVFIIGMGHELESGLLHERRAPDYDDWNLNGSLLFFYQLLDTVLSISSMGIRVDKKTLETQLTLAGVQERQGLDFHKMVLNEILPQSIGGGIGQSRLCMFFLEKLHIGEVQVSIWPEEMIKDCAKERIFLL